jgi:tRNA nucleotidyltransferase (CCA-adding enzyme)
MQVILTHEHTDFDALASLLAASLLYPDALPVLPRRLNRNVASFLSLYRNQFPFVTYKDLPRGEVERAILVDTRAVNFVKGMDSSTPQIIIDHHINDEALPTHYRLYHEPTGANVTLLVEKLRENDLSLSPLHATLLALGIHEDTGSLTYASTTHRDANALAWVMLPEHNVNLDVVNQFLSHPLNESQRALLDRLIDESRFVEVAGHTVVMT